jgi:hypothetical protein
MTFHPNSLKLDGDLKTLNDSITDKPIVLYKGFLHSKNILNFISLLRVIIQSKYQKID